AGPAPIGATSGAPSQNPPGAKALLLISPGDGTSLHLSRELRPEDQVIRIEAQPSSGVRYVELFVDGDLLAPIDAPPYRASGQLAEGAHHIRARAVAFDRTETWSDIVQITVWPP